jgi:hypothetical protein
MKLTKIICAPQLASMIFLFSLPNLAKRDNECILDATGYFFALSYIIWLMEIMW